MAGKYFGTDGIRGRANGTITPELALKVGQAAALIFRRGEYRHRVLIGKDTRLSGYMIETALIAGFTSVGMDVFQTGPMPTPAVAMLTRSMRADLGVMISASHNPYDDNGIKLVNAKMAKELLGSRAHRLGVSAGPDPDTVYVAVSGNGVNGLPGNTGIWKSSDGGSTWTNTTTSISTAAGSRAAAGSSRAMPASPPP